MRFYKYLVLLPIEKLYMLGLPVQSFTVYHLISLLAFPFLLLSKKIERSPIFYLLMFFFLYNIFITLFNLQTFAISINTNIDFYPIFRQTSGLITGIILFLVLRYSFKINPEVALKFIIYSLYIILLFIFIFDIVLNNKFFRFYGSFTEPSHLGQYMVFILLPSILLVESISKYKKIMLSLIILLIIFTFSLSTYIMFFLFLFFYAILGNIRDKQNFLIYSHKVSSSILKKILFNSGPYLLSLFLNMFFKKKCRINYE
jgi:hypothetical protein